MVKIMVYNKRPKFDRPIILLHPNIPKPMHGTNPRTVMGKVWWDKARKKSYQENNFCCFACGVHKTEAKYHKWLEAHESYKIDYKRGVMTLEEIVALCHSCHNYIHSGRMKALVNKHQMGYDRFHNILAHGESIISKIPSYIIPPKYLGPTAKWKDWHLVIDGERHYGKFKNLRQWEAFYG